jgi:hypothetical protein
MMILLLCLHLLAKRNVKCRDDEQGGATGGGENGEKSGVVVVDRNDGENNGDEHKVTSNY